MSKKELIKLKLTQSLEYALGKVFEKYSINNIQYDSYVKYINDNLIRPFNGDIYKQLSKGKGSELKESSGRPPKMYSTISSSALMYNVFESINYDTFRWQSNSFKGFEVEKQLTTVGSAKANLDGYLESSKSKFYIESKFTEGYLGSPKALNERYLNDSSISNNWQEFFKLWITNGTFIKDKRIYYKPLLKDYDAIQILLHALGIYRDVFEFHPLNYKDTDTVYLINLYWECPFDTTHKSISKHDNRMNKEIKDSSFILKLNEFMNKELKENNLKFKFIIMSYQEFIKEHQESFNQKDLDYLTKRYLLDK